MESRNSQEKEILCFACGKMRYGVDMPDVAEICTGIKICSVPLLPDYICGICSYKGDIIPVVRIDAPPDPKDSCEVMAPLLLVVNTPSGMMGIRLEDRPWISGIREEDRTVQFSDSLLPEGWAEQGVYKNGDGLLFLLDIKKSSENLTAFQK